MIDVWPEEKAYKEGPAEPTGAASGGLQPGPVRREERLAGETKERSEEGPRDMDRP